MSAWYEIIVRGSEDALRGFVAGYEAAQKKKDGALFGHDLDLEPSRFSQRLQELFAAGSHHLVFAGLRLKDALVAGLRDLGPDAGLHLEGVLEVLGARLPFSAEAYSQEVASAIRQKLLIGLPPDVAGEGIEEHEEIDQAARGARLYAPEHAYTYTVRGAFSGPLPGVIEMQRRARNLPFVRSRPLELKTRAIEDTEYTRE